MAKLHRIFVPTSRDVVFARVKLLDRPPSDHNPLLPDFEDNHSTGKKRFRFENGGCLKTLLKE